MNTTTAAVMSCFALGLGGVSAFLAFGPAQTGSTVQAGSVPLTNQGDLNDLTATVSELRQEVASLKERSQLAQVTPRTLAPVLGEDQIAQAVAAYFEEHGAGGSAAPNPLALKELGSPSDIADLLASADDMTRVGLWKRIVEEGRDAEILAHFKALADANPNDPDAQLALGQAYLGRTQEAGASPLAGKYASLADKALDAALTADPEHWDARFTKATALSFWPPVFGKQASAIQEFETLIGQQGGQTPNAKHASTHLLLGNMYHQTGQPEKALATWRSGLELYPGNEELANQIAILSGQ
ncbi:MAG: tetratricopeptide (TPR) repeat protein [Planctomycetota bacterium]|jgi:tetratricopeptide (TPR) repeat protein